MFAGIWGAWWIAILVAITHILIDGLKSYDEDTTPAFLADQIAHTGVLFIVGCILLNNDFTGTLRQIGIQLSESKAENNTQITMYGIRLFSGSWLLK